MTAASPSISTRSVSSINPRVFIYQDELGARQQHVVVSYTRGEPYIEIMGRHDHNGSNDYDSRDVVNFYLVKFDKACEDPQTCVAADFLTEAFEQEWEQVSVYEDLQVQDTTLDCLHCHQPEGSDGPKVMLFAEDRPNFTHWFDGYSNYGGELSEDDAALYETFYAAHDPALGYGVIPSERIGESDPKELWTAMYLSGHLNKQPIEFRDIEREFDDDGSSATWDSLYASFLAGERPPVPVPQNTADDPDLIASATQVYQDFLAGSLSRSDLPDFRAVHPQRLRPVPQSQPLAGDIQVPIRRHAAGHDARGGVSDRSGSDSAGTDRSPSHAAAPLPLPDHPAGRQARCVPARAARRGELDHGGDDVELTATRTRMGDRNGGDAAGVRLLRRRFGGRARRYGRGPRAQRERLIADRG
jgi:hypothetical protein